MKSRKLVVEDYREHGVAFSDKPFKVKKVVNSTNYTVDSWLRESQVETACMARDWTVEIVKKSK